MDEKEIKLILSSKLDTFVGKESSAINLLEIEELIEMELVWNEDTIDLLFKEGPDVVTPGSKMPVQRIKGEQDRADLISYLKRATEPQ